MPRGAGNRRRKLVTDEILKQAQQENYLSLRKGVALLWERVAEGDPEALAFVTTYTDGKPVSTLELDVSPEGEEALDALHQLSEIQRVQRIERMLALARSRAPIDVTPIQVALEDKTGDDLL